MDRAASAMGVALLLTFLGDSTWASPVWMPQFVSGGSGRNIRHLPCVSRRTGETGVCMFAFACMKANGTHLGTCIDRFYFGSCCQLDGQDPALITNPDYGIDDNTQDNRVPLLPERPFTSSSSSSSPQSPAPPPPSLSPPPPPPTTTTEQHLLLSTFQTVHDNTIDSVTEKYSTNIDVDSSPTPTTLTSKPITTTIKTTTTKRPTTITGTRKTTTTRPTTITTTTRKPTRKPVTKPPPNRTTTKKPATKPKPPSTTTRKPPTKKPTIKPLPQKPNSTTTTSRPTRPTTTRRPVVTTTKPPSQTTPYSTSTTSTTPEYILVSSTNHTSTTITPAITNSTSSSVATTETLDAVRLNDTLSFDVTTPTTTVPSLITWTMIDTGTSVSSTTTSSTQIVSSVSSTTATSSSVFTTGEDMGSGDEGSGDSVSDWVLLPVSTPADVSGETTSTPLQSATVADTVAMASPSTESTTSSLDSSTSGTAAETPPEFISTSSTSSTLSTTTSTTLSTLPSSTLSTSTTSPADLSNLQEIEHFLNVSDYKQVCGRRLFPESRIVGGEKATFGKWPWQISLRQWRTNTYLHKCGAALLNENWAITAAHCVENVPPADLLLRLGEHDLSTEDEPYGYQERRVQIVASHPQFDARTFEYDLALLRFYEPVTFQPNIVPICIPEDDRNFVGETAHVTGWGRLYEDGPLPSVLQEVSVPVINNSVCETMYRAAGYIEHIPDIFICAGWRKGGFDSCEGDSGGPMVIQRDDRRWLLAGIISWGIGCAEPNQPGVYTRISEFRDWINQILQF